jgi:kynurenine formamidase
MNRRFIDLSVSLRDDIASDPPGLTPTIEYQTHKQTASQLAAFFPGLQPGDLPNGEGWAIERLSLTTHNGTHLDAPWHFASTMNNGERAITIDEVPLEWCFNPGVKLDFRAFADGYVVTANDVSQELDRIGHRLRPLDIVLVNTRAGSHYGAEDYIHSGCGLGREATLYLLERGVRVTGTDGWSWDAPFSSTRQRWLRDHDPSIIWEGHKAGLVIGYCHIEKLSNLESLPSSGFTVSCFPVKIKGASAGWTRVVAIMDR